MRKGNGGLKNTWEIWMDDVLGYENVRNFCSYDYVCLSAHFIDENWKLRKWVLYFRCLWDPSVNCSEDCGMFKSLEALETHVQEKKELQLSGQLFNVYCFGEIISQMVEDAFRKISDLIDRVGELYSLKPLPLWYLTSSNLKQALELWSMGEFSSKDATDFYDVPSPEEWKIVEGVCKIVDSIYEVSNALFQTKHLTANVYLYHLHELREILSQMSSESEGFIATIVQDMMKKFDKYWDHMFLLLAICAVLDPRFKMKYVEFMRSKVKGGDGSSQVAAVLGRFPEKENFISESSFRRGVSS